MEPSRAFEDVVGANPESLFESSLSTTLLSGLRSAGCMVSGGARGGAIVTGKGGFEGMQSSYREEINFSSACVVDCVTSESVRMLLSR